MIPSKPYLAWEKTAIPQIQAQFQRPPITTPCSIEALFFRKRCTGDLNNFLAAVADALQKAGVLVNDSLVFSWDGSRRMLSADPLHTHTVVTIRVPAPGEVPTEFQSVARKKAAA